MFDKMSYWYETITVNVNFWVLILSIASEAFVKKANKLAMLSAEVDNPYLL